MLVFLATVVTVLEAAAAVLVYALVSLMTQEDARLDLPILGNASRWLPDMSTNDLRRGDVGGAMRDASSGSFPPITLARPDPGSMPAMMTTIPPHDTSLHGWDALDPRLCR